MENTPPFKVGDKVTTDYYDQQKSLIRTVVAVTKYSGCKSGWAVYADGGEPCQSCGHVKGSAIKGSHGLGVDSGWFKKVEQ